MVTIEFPDKTVKKFSKGVTPIEIAKSISAGLARKVLAASIDNLVIDANQPLSSDKKIKLELLTWNQIEGKSTLWHSSAHILAEAIEHFYPKAKFAIFQRGPPTF